MKTCTDSDFDDLSWHDCSIWSIGFRAGDPDEGDWTSDLVLDIDFIVEWICGVDPAALFRVAPATLVFHGVTDPCINVEWQRSGFQAALHLPSIGQIERVRIEAQKVFLDRPYYAWKIVLNWPQGGEIGFGAVGFTQTLRAEPIVTDKQHLSASQRGGPT